MGDISMSISLGDAIIAINKDAKFTIRGNTFPIEWMDGTTPIVEADITVKQVELQSDYDSKEYQRKREPEYPTIEDQLDKIYHEGIDAWKTDMIKPVKDKYPKE